MDIEMKDIHDRESTTSAIRKGKTGKGHRPKSSSSHNSRASSSLSDMPPAVEPELARLQAPSATQSRSASPALSHRNMRSHSPFENMNVDKSPMRAPKSRADTIVMVETNEDEIETIPFEEEDGDKTGRKSGNSTRQGARSVSPTKDGTNHSSALKRNASDGANKTSLWSKLRSSFSRKKKDESNKEEEQISAKPKVPPTEFNKTVQDKRMKIVLSMMETTDKIAEEEYDNMLEVRKRELKQRKIDEDRRDERLFKQAMRGQLNCDAHQKTIYSLNHLLKLERQYDDSLVTSICDIVLQKPVLRAELIRYVKQEKESVLKLLDEAAQRNPENIPKIAKAVSEVQNVDVPRQAFSRPSTSLTNKTNASRPTSAADTAKMFQASGHTNDNKQGQTNNQSEPQLQETKTEEIDETEQHASRRKKKRRVRKNKENKEKKVDEEKQGGSLTARTAGADTNPKTPAYPPEGPLMQHDKESDPSRKIEDKELANYVKTLENTVDDKLRVLLDTHSNQTDNKKGTAKPMP